MQLLSATPSCAKSCSLSPPLFWQRMDRSGEGYKSVDKTQNEERKFLKCLVPPLMAAIVALSPLCNTPVSLGQTIDGQKGATLFHRACIGCHDSGGNIIQPGATLFLKDLERNGVDKEEEIYQVTYYGKGRMPVSFLCLIMKSLSVVWTKDEHKTSCFYRVLVRIALLEVNAHLDLDYKKMRLNF
ncbi:cytochrome c6, chloroplastic [Olea europaea subsp. europaea]|uniref:Cytochrome c-553 n=1 Tax=Olea europaea subsp. europaea TaxID=158383 RepID=A0A8S0V5N6_OLEEU|nr:cytochrome c6, chloroplastic [Olea europaea subsp. europaea]